MNTDMHKAEIAAIDADAEAYRALPAREKLGHLIAALQRTYDGTGPGEADADYAAIFGAAPEPADDREVEARIRQCLKGYGFANLFQSE